MTARLWTAAAVGLGAAAGFFAADWLDRRRAEKRTLTGADMRWMAATHKEGQAGA